MSCDANTNYDEAVYESLLGRPAYNRGGRRGMGLSMRVEKDGYVGTSALIDLHREQRLSVDGSTSLMRSIEQVIDSRNRDPRGTVNWDKVHGRI